MPTLTYQGDVALTLKGPGDGVLQPTLSAAPPSDRNSLDAGVWPQGGNLTWAAGPFPSEPLYFPSFQFCQFFPGGYATTNFTDSQGATFVSAAAAIAFQGKVYGARVVTGTRQLSFLELKLGQSATNAIATRANVPFNHPFGTAAIDNGTNGLFIAAIAPETAGVVFLEISGPQVGSLYAYPQTLSVLGLGNGAITRSFGTNFRNSPDFASALNYTLSLDGVNFYLSQWSFASASALSIAAGPTLVSYDAPLTARGVIDMKPCAFGWLLRVGSLSVSGKNTTFVLASRDLTKYWSLILTPAPLSASGYGFTDLNFGLTIDAAGYLYQHSQTANLFATASSSSDPPATLPLSASVPDLNGLIPDGGAPAGDGTNPLILLQISNDGGRTWSQERAASMGKLGDYSRLVRWRRLGRSMNRAWRVICSEPVDASLVAADLDAHG